MTDKLPPSKVEYPIDTSAFKTLHVPEIQAQSLVAMLYNYTTGQYDAMPARWFESGMDLADYVPVQGRAVYVESIANGDRPIQAMMEALGLVIDVEKGGDE